MKSSLVSIITPVYNARDFLSFAIQSVIDQTYNNWELLLLDDFSTDDSCQVAYKYTEQDPRVKLIKNSENLGVSATRNIGIEMAIGDWVAFLDADDIWGKDKLQLQLQLAEETGAGFIYGNYDHISELGKFQKTINCKPCADYEDMLRGSQIGCLTALVKAEILKKHRFVDVFHEDYILWLEILKEDCRQAFGVQKSIASYRLRQNSRSANKLECIKSQWEIYRNYCDLSFFKSLMLLFEYTKNGIIKHWIP